MNRKMTFEEAVKHHRDMWEEMQRTIGDKPTKLERVMFKSTYTARFGSCLNLCFLCEYAATEADENCDLNMCSYCPVDWTDLAEAGDPDTGTCLALYKDGYDPIYRCAPISEILNLPVKGEE